MKNHVLFVEDDEFVSVFYKHLGEESELIKHFDLAGSKQEAIEALSANEYDMIVSDLSLGDGNGLELIPFAKGIPIVIVTGKGTEASAIQAMQLGVFDYIVKDSEFRFLEKLNISIIKAFEHTNLLKQLKKSQDEYKRLIENANDLIYEIDKTGIVTFVNEFGARSLGYKKEDLMGSSFIGFIREDYKTTAIEFYKDGYKNKIEETYLELPLTKKNGEDLWIGQSVRSNSSGGDYMAIGRDITQKIETDRHIKNQNILLEEKNKEINDTLEEVIKARASKKATVFILIIALFLFVFSEGLLEPYIEREFPNLYSGFLVKGVIALLLKPIEIGIERFLVHRKIKHPETNSLSVEKFTLGLPKL